MEFIFKTTVDYLLCYKDLQAITQGLQDEGVTWAENEAVYFKKILLSYKGKFTYPDFLKASKTEMSKQGAFKILNKFVSYGLLAFSESQSKTKLFDVNIERLPFLPSNFRNAG